MVHICIIVPRWGDSVDGWRKLDCRKKKRSTEIRTFLGVPQLILNYALNSGGPTARFHIVPLSVGGPLGEHPAAANGRHLNR